MNRRLIGLVSGAFALSTATAGLTMLYACSGDDSSSAPPPVNEDAGQKSDSGGTTNNEDAGNKTSPDGGDAGTPAPACSSLPGSVIYIESGDTQEPILDEVGRELRDQANITIVFLLTGSCTLTPNVFSQTAIPTGTQMLYIPSTAENPGWTTSDPESTCAITTPVAPNLGIAALFTSSCGSSYVTPPTGIGTFLGPIQAYTFVVPTAEFATQTSISAEEAYYAVGDGANNPVLFGGASEWNVPSQLFLRPAAKSTMISTALNIGLTVAQATLAEADGGTADGRNLVPSSGGVITDVKGSTSMQALGILGDEVYDPIRGAGINVLAFQGFGQTAAYYPDSTTSSFDKQNIRDGHYTLWSPTDYIALVDGTGTPSNPTVKYVLDVMTGAQNPTPPNGFVDGGTPINGLDAVIGADLTPYCAMQVQRTGDGTPLTPYTPPAPCTCYFLTHATGSPTVPASCVACSASSPCATGTCYNGFCEVPPTVDSDGGSLSIENAPTTATAIVKAGVVYPDDGGLQPLNP